MADDRSAERDLDRFWNDLVAGNPPAEDDRLDPGDAEAIRRFRDHATAPQPRSSRDRVRARVDAEIDRLERGPSANGRVGAAAGAGAIPIGRDPRGPHPSTPLPAQASGRRSPVWIAVAAAVLALAVGGFGLRASWWSAPEERATIPAVVAPATSVPTATAIPGVTKGDLFEVELPAEAVPAGRASVGLQHLTLPPGERAASTHDAHNVHVQHLLSGALTLRFDGTVQLLRAGGNGAWEALPADAAVTLGTGDSVLFLDRSDVEIANPGPAPAEVLGFALTSDGGSPMETSAWIVNDSALFGTAYPMSGEGIVLPGSPVVIRLTRAVLEPQAALPAAPVDRFRLAVAVPDNGFGTPVVPNLAMPPDGRIANRGTTTTAVFGVTLEIPGATGTPLAADRGDEGREEQLR